MTSKLRMPAVAGRFYPAGAEELVRDVGSYTAAQDGSGRANRIWALGCVSPHAGYIYSGAVAGAVYARLEIPKTCVILCPNHTGRGVPVAIMVDTRWQTPLGEVGAEAEFGARLLRTFPALEENSSAHDLEHAIEVQLPFLQAREPRVRIVPIALGVHDFEVLEGLGVALAEVICGSGDVLVVASSDMNHYESEAITRRKDGEAIARLLALDARGLWEVVKKEKITMCGIGPAVVMLTAAKRMGAGRATLVRYATSGEVSGDYGSVVGYAGIIVSR
jgi:AmmeMemoRadiSam system protein B